MKNIRLGDLLIELGYITPDQLTAALAYQKEHRDLRVGQALQELGYVNERQVLEALAKRLQIQLIDIEHTTVDVTAVEKVPQELAQKYDMLPIAQNARTLTVAANDPLNYYAIEDIRQLTGMEPEIVLAELEPLRRAIRYYYAEVGAQQAAQNANEDFAERNVEMLQVEESESGDPEAPIVKLLNSLLDRAISTYADKAGATVKADGKAAVITPEVNEIVVKSARNLPGVTTAPAKLINVYDLLNAKTLVIDKEALAVIEEVFA